MAQAVEVTVGIRWGEGMRFDAEGADAVSVRIDAATEHGGAQSGFRPMELMLAALGSCTGMDVISILRKKRQDVTQYRVEVTGHRSEGIPHVFARIRVLHVIHGNEVSEERVRRAIELSETKYCPAYAMLSKAAEISSEFEVHPAAPAD